MIRRYRPIAAAIIACTAVTAVPAATLSPPAGEAEAMLERLAQADGRVAAIAFRLLAGGVPLCRETAPASGLLFHDVRQYSAELRPAAARAFGFAGRPVVLAVAPGSPAALAGIRAGDTIRAIGGVPVAEIRPASPDRRRQGNEATEDIEARLQAAMEQGAVLLEVASDGVARNIQLQPAPACASTVQLEPGNDFNAWSDGQAVAITTALADATRSDDELAALIGHEIAHNILGHRRTLAGQGIGKGIFSRIGAKARKVRVTEAEADYLGVYLAARAGYDPRAAAAFWRREGSRHDGGPFADSTHPAWREREAELARAAAEIAGKRIRAEPIVPEPFRASGSAR